MASLTISVLNMSHSIGSTEDHSGTLDPDEREDGAHDLMVLGRSLLFRVSCL